MPDGMWPDLSLSEWERAEERGYWVHKVHFLGQHAAALEMALFYSRMAMQFDVPSALMQPYMCFPVQIPSTLPHSTSVVEPVCSPVVAGNKAAEDCSGPNIVLGGQSSYKQRTPCVTQDVEQVQRNEAPSLASGRYFTNSKHNWSALLEDAAEDDHDDAEEEKQEVVAIDATDSVHGMGSVVDVATFAVKHSQHTQKSVEQIVREATSSGIGARLDCRAAKSLLAPSVPSLFGACDTFAGLTGVGSVAVLTPDERDTSASTSAGADAPLDSEQAASEQSDRQEAASWQAMRTLATATQDAYLFLECLQEIYEIGRSQPSGEQLERTALKYQGSLDRAVATECLTCVHASPELSSHIKFFKQKLGIADQA